MRVAYLKLYCLSHHLLDQTLKKIKKKNNLSYSYLPVKKKGHYFRKTSNGRGYSTYERWSAKLLKAVLLLKDYDKFKLASKIKLPVGIYGELKLLV